MFYIYSISGEQNIFDVVAAETNLCDTKDDILDAIMNTIERKWHLTHKRSFPFGGCESNLLLHLLTYTRLITSCRNASVTLLFGEMWNVKGYTIHIQGSLMRSFQVRANFRTV